MTLDTYLYDSSNCHWDYEGYITTGCVEDRAGENLLGSVNQHVFVNNRFYEYTDPFCDSVHVDVELGDELTVQVSSINQIFVYYDPVNGLRRAQPVYGNVPSNSNYYFGVMRNPVDISSFSPLDKCVIRFKANIHDIASWSNSHFGLSRQVDKYGTVCDQRFYLDPRPYGSEFSDRDTGTLEHVAKVENSGLIHPIYIDGATYLQVLNSDVTGVFMMRGYTYVYEWHPGLGHAVHIKDVPIKSAVIKDSCFKYGAYSYDSANHMFDPSRRVLTNDLSILKSNIHLTVKNTHGDQTAAYMKKFHATGYKGKVSLIFSGSNPYCSAVLGGTSIEHLTVSINTGIELLVSSTARRELKNITVNININTDTKILAVKLLDLDTPLDNLTINLSGYIYHGFVEDESIPLRLIPIIIGGKFDPDDPQPNQTWSGNSCTVAFATSYGSGVPIDLSKYHIRTNYLESMGDASYSTYYLPDGRDLAEDIVRKYDFSPLFVGNISGDVSISNGAKKIIAPDVPPEGSGGTIEC